MSLILQAKSIIYLNYHRKRNIDFFLNKKGQNCPFFVSLILLVKSLLRILVRLRKRY